MKAPQGIASSFEDIRADYDATRQSRFVRRRTGVAAQGSDQDYHFRSESKYYDLIEQARDMDRNDGLVGILADRRVDNIVQSGFTLDSKTGDKKLDLDLWQRWEDFSNDADQCDIAGECVWKEIERQACRSESIDGDIIVVGTEDGPFQQFEAHTIQTSSRIENTFLGVTRDQYRKRLQYHIREDLNEFAGKGQSVPIDVRNDQGMRQLFHVYNPKRVNATRGVTQLAPIFAMSGMLEDVNFAKLVQQQVVSCFAIFRKLVAGANALPSVDGYGDASTEQTAAGVRQIEGVSPGMEIVGAPGEELQGFSPNVPNSEYFQQVKLLLQIIGVNFGLPLCLVLMDGSETNFSGWRGAVDEARKGFVADQQNLVRRLNKPAYCWKLSQWIEGDPALRRAAAKLGNKIYDHNWNLPTWSYIEPVADAEGDAKQLRNALTSPRRMHAARGKDWETITEEITDDNAYAISMAQRKADALNKEFGLSLTYRDLIPLPMQEGTTMAMQDPAAIAVQEETAGDAKKKPQAKAKLKPVAFDESKVTRDDDGKFGSGGGGGSKAVKDWAEKRFSTPEQAQAFTEYFGDSKAVDENGEPLTLYHGTPNGGFAEFNTGKNTHGAVLGYGAYFTDNPVRASAYAGDTEGSSVMATHLSAQRPIDLNSTITKDESDRIGKVLASSMPGGEKSLLLSPRVAKTFSDANDGKSFYREKMAEWNQIGDKLDRTKPKVGKSGSEFSIEYNDSSKIDVGTKASEVFATIQKLHDSSSSSILMAAGFDSVRRGDEWVMFSPTQIKSATGNSGKFDKQDPRIDAKSDATVTIKGFGNV